MPRSIDPPFFENVEQVDVDLHRALLRLGTRAPKTHPVASCVSTQRLALNLSNDDSPHGALVWTRHQSGGRGRGGRSWQTTDGALLFSMVCRPQLPLVKLPRLTLLTGTALLCALRKLGVNAQLKWPNDVVIETKGTAVDAPLGRYRKLAGILVDVSTRGAQLERAVVGVGLNAGNGMPSCNDDDTVVSPDDLTNIACGLQDLENPPDRADIIFEVLSEMRIWLRGDDDDALFAAALDEQRSHSMTLGSNVNVPDENLQGVAKDFASDGALLVEDSSGRVHRVVAGDVWPQ